MRVRKVNITQDTITVQRVEPQPETITLRIVGAASGGFFAVEYEDLGRTVCGQFVDMEDQQELYADREDAKFHGDNANYLVMPNGDGFKWSELSKTKTGSER